MSSIDDLAIEAARRIIEEFDLAEGRNVEKREARIAAIVATYAGPLVALLREARREHLHCDDDSWYCCRACHAADHGLAEGESLREGERWGTAVGVCTCDADAWNARVDAVLAGQELP